MAISLYYKPVVIRNPNAVRLEGIIKNEKPILMVCLYHTKDDLWELPLLINEMRNDYKFYIRQHYPNGLETVLYCV